MKGKRSVTCGLCPCIKRPACTFEDTDLVRCALSPTSKLRSYNAAPNTSKNSSKSKLLLVLFAFVHFLLYLCRVKWGIGAKMYFAPKKRKKNEM